MARVREYALAEVWLRSPIIVCDPDGAAADDEFVIVDGVHRTAAALYSGVDDELVVLVGPSLRGVVEAGDAHPVVAQIGTGTPRRWFLKEGVVEVVRDGSGDIEILAESLGIIGEGYLPPARTSSRSHQYPR